VEYARKSGDIALQKIDAYNQAYNVLVANPDKLNPEIAAGLSKLLSGYHSRAAKQ
jgi:hypothetical protein